MIHEVSIYIHLLFFSFQRVPCIVHIELDLSLLYGAWLCPLDKYVSPSLTHAHAHTHEQCIQKGRGYSLPMNCLATNHQTSNEFALAAWIAGLVQTLLYADFFYYYILR